LFDKIFKDAKVVGKKNETTEGHLYFHIKE